MLLKYTKNLEILIITSADLEEVPAEILDLQSLKVLALESNRLKRLPAGFRNLKKLETLSLFMNEGLENVDEVVHLPNLEQLNLSFCRMKSLPANLGNLSKLEEIDLKVNELSVLPSSITQLNQLHKLEASLNKLESIPAGFAHFKALEVLLLNNCGYTQISTPIFGLKNLRKLYLTENAISEVSAGILALQKLEILDMNENQITRFPANLPLLPALKEVYFVKNNIEHLPQNYPYRKGAALDLSKNLINNHPDELLKLANWKDYICSVPETYFIQKQFKKALETAAICTKEYPRDESKLDPKNHIRYAMYAQDAQQTIDLAKRFLNWHSQETYMNARLVIGYILNEQFNEAEKLIKEWKGKKFSNGKDAYAYILNEIMLMEYNGIMHVDFARVKKLLQ